MRKYDNMIEDYLIWYNKQQKEKNKDLINLDEYLKDKSKESTIKKGKVWAEILRLCYLPEEGIYWFTKFILGDLMYAGYPNPIRFNHLWWKWTKIANSGDHISIKCSRQHGKSTYWTVLQSIYRTSLFEHYNVLIESASEDQAVMLMGYIVNIINNNEFLQEKKAKNAKWSTTEISFNGGKIVGKGVGSEVRGGTYDYIVCDDILRSDNKLSDTDIEKFVGEELEAMIFVRKGQLIIVGTPKSESDIFSTIEEQNADGKGGWKQYTYPAILDWDNKEILCSDRFTWNQLMQKRKIMGAMKFDKEFMCQTYSSGSQLFPNELRKRSMKTGKDYVLYSKAKPEEINKIAYYIGVDVARAGTASGDYTVATVIAYNTEDQTKRIVWLWRKKGLKINKQVEQIAEISKNFNNPVVLVEQNNIGQDFIDVMVDNYNLNVESFITTKGSKYEDLIRYLVAAFENEKIIMPTGNEFSKEVIKDLDRELERFVVEITKAGNEVFKGSGHSHDDMVISLALANRCTQSYGYSPFSSSLAATKSSALEKFAATGDLREVLRF